MNKTSRDKKFSARRLVALLLCCFCLLAALPVAALADTDDDALILDAAVTEEQPQAESDLVVEEAPALTFYDRLMSAVSCWDIYALLTADENQADALALTGEQLDALNARAWELGDDGSLDDLLAALNALMSPAESVEYSQEEEYVEEDYQEEDEQPEEPQEDSEDEYVEESEPEEEYEEEPEEEVEDEFSAEAAAEELYWRLMSCDTLEEMNEILDNLTEEEEALLDLFTDEQNANLEEKMEELDAYEVSVSSPEYLDQIQQLKALFEELDADSEDYDSQLEEINAQLTEIVDAATVDYNDGCLSEEEYMDVYAAAEELYELMGGDGEPETIANYTGTITITNTIETNGCLNVTVPANTTDAEYTFTWEKQSGGAWVEVEREKVTGDSYNISEDGRSINVALDDGAQQTYRAKVATINGKAVGTSSYSGGTKVDYYDELQNGSFESPVINKFEDQSVASGGDVIWKTTARSGKIELLNTSKEGDKSFAWHGVSNAADGVQCAEINADGAGALYQDVLTVPGSTMYWQLSHLGRSMDNKGYYNGLNKEYTDTMYVLIMPYESAKNITTQAQVKNVLNSIVSYPGASVETITYTWKWTSSGDGKNKTYTMQHKVNGQWVDTYQYTGDQKSDTDFEHKRLADPWEVHSGSYTVPEGQYLTRYFFISGTTARGDETTGNHIDSVWFSTELPPANPGSISLTIKKTINVDGWNDMSDDQKNAFKNSISFNTNLTGYASISGSQMTWNDNVGTYNIQNYSIDTDPSMSVTVAETTTDVDGYTLSSDPSSRSVDLTIGAGGVGKAEFTNTYTPSTYDLTIRKTLSGNMFNANDTFSFTVSYGNSKDTFTLGNNGEKTIAVPADASVTITEVSGDYTFSVKSVDPSNLSYTNVTDGSGISFTMPQSNVTVEIENSKNITLDTGVLLDTLPYIIILVIVATGAVLMLKKRSRREN